VFVVVMENHGYSRVWNTGDTPFVTRFARQWATATNYWALTHPSLPNYLDLYSATRGSITTDCSPSGSCHVAGPGLGDRIEASGLRWKSYQESMGSPCRLTSSGSYAPKHNPVVYFESVRLNPARCAAHVVDYSFLADDLRSGATTPNYAFITSNLCSDTHDCPVAVGDAWLSRNLPPILASPACAVERCLLVLTWDEGGGFDGNHVLTVLAGSLARQAASSQTRYDHYSVVRTAEQVLGLSGFVGGEASSAPMTDLLR
jgi:acid phosphatase